MPRPRLPIAHRSAAFSAVARHCQSIAGGGDVFRWVTAFWDY
jgi:hypothetical protein